MSIVPEYLSGKIFIRLMSKGIYSQLHITKRLKIFKAQAKKRVQVKIIFTSSLDNMKKGLYIHMYCSFQLYLTPMSQIMLNSMGNLWSIIPLLLLPPRAPPLAFKRSGLLFMHIIHSVFEGTKVCVYGIDNSELSTDKSNQFIIFQSVFAVHIS